MDALSGFERAGQANILLLFKGVVGMWIVRDVTVWILRAPHVTSSIDDAYPLIYLKYSCCRHICLSWYFGVVYVWGVAKFWPGFTPAPATSGAIKGAGRRLVKRNINNILG